MSRLKYIALGLPVAVLVTIVACQDAVDTTGPDAAKTADIENPVTGIEQVRTLDDWFILKAREVSGFAGAYFDQDGTLIIRLVNTNARAAAEAAVTSFFAERRDVLGTRVLPAEYDFLTLAEWRVRARTGILTLDGVVSLDVDEMRNRLVIGTEDLTARGSIDGRLRELGIPSEAVVIEQEEVWELTQLSERWRPVVGALGTTFTYNDTNWSCTLGFNAVYRDIYFQRDTVFSTNSHCSEYYGAVEGLRYNQWIHRIGQEFLDPPIFYHDDEPYWCPYGASCRWSDFLLGKYDAGVEREVGLIARTTYRSRTAGSTLINSSDSVFYVTATDDLPVGGQQLDKIGAATGWTWGYVTKTCRDYFLDGVYKICQYGVSGGVDRGDSGSPVFRWTGEKEIMAYGILWGGSGWGGAPTRDIPFQSIVGH